MREHRLGIGIAEFGPPGQRLETDHGAVGEHRDRLKCRGQAGSGHGSVQNRGVCHAVTAPRRNGRHLIPPALRNA